ncbi:MAG TPA: cupin-like domain-containing protein [Polyangiaceae bacterium]|nr:cupin-like domain-containing protein [Polyangiaceae bacterium]
MLEATPVEEIFASTLTPDHFRARAGKQRTPVVFRGLASRWPARQWDFPDIQSVLPDRAIEGHGASARDGVSVCRIRVSPRELVEQLKSASVAGEPLDWFFDLKTELPELASQVPAIDVVRPLSRHSALIGRDTFTRGHYHSREHAMICQVHGRKRVILYSPADSSRVYPYPWKFGSAQHEYSRLDFENPDLRAFSKASRAQRREVTLEPSDCLFIPMRWWHCVRGLGATMSVSLLWHANWHEYGLSRATVAALAGMPLRALRPQ